jgi:predicted Holliday junction resolvase-like endonuclease
MNVQPALGLISHIASDGLALLCLAAGAGIGAFFSFILLKKSEKRIRRQALESSRVTLKGKIHEQLAPLLPGFNYNPADARFLGNPIDYVIFEGYTEAKEGKGSVRRIVLMDVKTGKAKLSDSQKKIKEAVESGAVIWETLELEG